MSRRPPKILLLFLLSATLARADETPVLSPMDPELIDAGIEAVLKREEFSPSPLCDDASFLRRVTLDVTGVIPASTRVEAFLADKTPEKRQLEIDRLLDSAEFPRRLAEQLSQVLLEDLAEEGEAQGYRRLFRDWLEDEVGSDRGWDQTAASMLAGEGDSSQDPRVLYAFDHGREAPADLAGAATRHFLGLRLECARCHDHPFSSYTQEEFHGLAAWFARLRVSPQPGRQGVFRLSEAPLGEHRFTLPGGERRQFEPSFLPLPEGSPSELRPGPLPVKTNARSRRVRFARWVTSPDNPWFARAAVNRVWLLLFGRALVGPVDDLSDAELAAHGPLLQKLGEAFAQGGFSFKQLYRAVLGSKTYQRAARHKDAEKARTLFAAASVRPLDPSALTNSFLLTAGRERPGPGEPDYVYRGLRERLQGELKRGAAESEDASSVTVAQALVVLNGRGPTGLVTGKLLDELVAAHRRPRDVVRALYLRTLSRPPQAREMQVSLRFLRRAGGERTALEDLLWALVASNEYLTNH